MKTKICEFDVFAENAMARFQISDMQAKLDAQPFYTYQTIMDAIDLMVKYYISDTQRKYWIEYYENRIKMDDIAKKYGVRPAAVSRALKRARYTIRRLCYICYPVLRGDNKQQNIERSYDDVLHGRTS